MTASTKYAPRYSLSKILHSVCQESRTGLISTLANSSSKTSINTHYLWVQNGEIVAISNKLDGMGLLGEISRRKLLSSAQIREVSTQLTKLSQPLGLHLKSLDLLDAAQLKLLFNAQIFSLFKVHGIDNRLFNFDSDILPSNAEMTGICMPPQEIMRLLNLKALTDSSSLTPQLADRHITIPPSDSPLPLPKAKVLSTSFFGNLMGFLKRKG
jgi:hypothetical protein